MGDPTQIAPHPFTLRQLQYVLAVAEFRSFRKAAEACRVSQPSLSAQIAQVEMLLGVRLFERDRKGVLLTAAAQRLIERARQLVIAADDLVAEARVHVDPLAGTLRFGTIPTVAPYLVPEVAPVIRRRLPKMTMLWIEEKTESLLSRLRAGTLDAALLAIDASVAEFEHRDVMVDPFVVATPADHPLAQQTKLASTAALKGERMLLLEEGHCLRDQALSVCRGARIEELSFRATSLPTLTQMVASGAGVTLLPRLAIPTETRRGKLALVPFRDPAPNRKLGVIWRKQSPFGPALEQLAEIISQVCQGLEPTLNRAVLHHSKSHRRGITQSDVAK